MLSDAPGSPLRAQVLPKASLADGPRGSKAAVDCAGTDQDASTTAIEGPKTAQDGLKAAQDVPNRPQESSNKPSRTP